MAAQIEVTRVEVRNDRIAVLIQWPDAFDRATNDALAAAVVARYPDLPAHSCVNERGERFGDVIASTPGPHLLEHLVLSEMAADAATPPELLFCATSQWMDYDRGIARLELAYHDDLVALRALNRVVALLNELYSADLAARGRAGAGL